MRRSDFRFDLPEELIAQYPLPVRSASRLLCLIDGQVADRQFSDLLELLRPEDLLVFNNTRVIPARLLGEKETGGKVEVLVERVLDEHQVLAHVRASKAPKPGRRLLLEGAVEAEVSGRQGELFVIRFLGSETVMAQLQAHGHMPLPPYIARADEAADQERYQTVYAERPGAVAAPTAGLHFDEAMLERLDEQGVRRGFVTLHVGAGTFQPVREEELDRHQMHSEWLEVTETLVAQVAETRARGGRVIAVGTTAVRCLETASASGELRPYAGDTQLFIRPGYQYQVVDAMVTNFHLPESTLLMLVCAFAGYEPMMQAYAHAVEQRYRFFSYGDAMFLTRNPNAAKEIPHGI